MKVRLVAALVTATLAAAARAAPPVTVTLLHVGELDAQLEPHPEVPSREAKPSPGQPFPTMGGFARIRTVLDRERSRSTRASFITAAGEAFHGSGPAAWSRGEVVVEPLRALGLDVRVRGEGDLVWGAGRYHDLSRRAGVREAGVDPFDVAARRGTDPPVTIRRGGATVTFLGLASPPADLLALGARVAEARRRERPDVVVALVQGGLEASRQLARAVPGIDLVLSGGTRERDGPTFEGNTAIVQVGTGGSFVARVDLAASRGRVQLLSYRLVPVDAQVREDPTVRGIVQRQLQPWRERMRRVVGHTATAIARDGSLESSADNLISDAIREAAGVQIAIAGGIGGGVPIPPGPITEAQLWDLMPADAADAPLEAGWATGLQVAHLLEREVAALFAGQPWASGRQAPPSASGLEVTLTAAPPPGRRHVWSIRFQGALVRHDVAYTLALVGQRGRARESAAASRDAQELHPLNMTLREAVVRYLASHAVVGPRKEGRVAATDDVRLARQDLGGASFQSRSSSW